MPFHRCVSRVLIKGLANRRCLVSVGWPLIFNYPRGDVPFALQRLIKNTEAHK